MRKRRLWRHLGQALIAILLVAGHVTSSHAITSTSNNFEVSETQFGAGSTQQSCSAQYCGQVSLGSSSSGASAGTTATFGALQSDEPRLEMIVTPGPSNLGILSPESTATKTTSIQIRNYMGAGYTLQIVGSPPKIASHTLNPLSSPLASKPGAEQFGINVVANTTPSVGASPLQFPSDQGDFGAAADDYKTTNLFKYLDGDVVARSSAPSGRTDYTISMIVNISSATPAGHYTSDFSAVVMPAY